MKENVKKFIKDNRAVFGLTSVKAFFAIVLAVALLAYVIVVIMGTLNTTTLIPQLNGAEYNEVGYINTSTYTLTKSSALGFNTPVIVSAINRTSGALIGAGNYTVSSLGVVSNASAIVYTNVSFNYTYIYNSQSTNNLNSITGNTSTGITGFFSNISPVYGILAILVIILVLVVLVRVVTGGGMGQRESSVPL